MGHSHASNQQRRAHDSRLLARHPLPRVTVSESSWRQKNSLSCDDTENTTRILKSNRNQSGIVQPTLENSSSTFLHTHAASAPNACHEREEAAEIFLAFVLARRRRLVTHARLSVSVHPASNSGETAIWWARNIPSSAPRVGTSDLVRGIGGGKGRMVLRVWLLATLGEVLVVPATRNLFSRQAHRHPAALCTEAAAFTVYTRLRG